MSPEVFKMIQESAYYTWLRYEGFVDSHTCWLEAEAEILRGQSREENKNKEIDRIIQNINEGK